MPMVRVDHKGGVRQRVDELVALHGMAHNEAGCGIVGTNKNQLSVNKGVAVIPIQGRSFETVGQDTDGLATSLQCAPHCGLVDSARAAGDDRRVRVSGELANVFRVFDEVILDLPRTHHRQPADVQYRAIPAPVEDRRGVSSHPGLQPSRIVRISPGNHPQGARAPSLERLRQEKPAAEKPVNSLGVQAGEAFPHRFPSVTTEQIGWLAVDGPKPRGEIAILGGAQWTQFGRTQAASLGPPLEGVSAGPRATARSTAESPARSGLGRRSSAPSQ